MSPVGVTNLSFCSDSSIAGLWSDPLTVLVFHVFEMSLMENKCLKCQFPSLESAVSRRASCQLLAKNGHLIHVLVN